MTTTCYYDTFTVLQPHVHDHVNMIINQVYQLCPTNTLYIWFTDNDTSHQLANRLVGVCIKKQSIHQDSRQ